MPENRTKDHAVGLDLLLAVQRGAGPLHVQVESALREAIVTGTLAAGTSLPASRTLAGQLGVSRSVVNEAYAQLRAEGFLDVAPRALPRVAAGSAPDAPAPVPELPMAHWRLD